ncbi:uracil-DNA glycosylase [Campylobacterota bacterium]
MNGLPSRLRRFTRRLQDEDFETGVTNFYSAKRTNLQRANLERYLKFMYEQKSITLLVGEAPGYNGCRLTGVPFSSEDIIRSGVCEGRVFGEHNGYKASAKRAKKEQSASAMWSVLETFDTLPLLWNAFPFHPYKEGNINSNRKPNVKELEIGRYYLHELIEIFGIQDVLAVGNVADDVLTRMNIEHTKIRHPSYGGKNLFKEQLFSYYKTRESVERT